MINCQYSQGSIEVYDSIVPQYNCKHSQAFFPLIQPSAQPLELVCLEISDVRDCSKLGQIDHKLEFFFQFGANLIQFGANRDIAD